MLLCSHLFFNIIVTAVSYTEIAAAKGAKHVCISCTRLRNALKFSYTIRFVFQPFEFNNCFAFRTRWCAIIRHICVGMRNGSYWTNDSVRKSTLADRCELQIFDTVLLRACTAVLMLPRRCFFLFLFLSFVKSRLRVFLCSV